MWNLQKSLLDGALKYRHLHKAAASLSGMVEEEEKKTLGPLVSRAKDAAEIIALVMTRHCSAPRLPLTLHEM